MTAAHPIVLGDNTVYLVETDGSRVLVDTGPDFRGSAELLLDALGGKMPEVVIATHGHLDHAGLGRWWQERGVPVGLQRADWPLARGEAPDDEEFAALERFAMASGAPSDVAAEAVAAIRARRAWNASARAGTGYPPPGRDRRWPSGLRYLPFTPSAELADVQVPGIELLHLPGHTPGNAVAWLPSEGWLFAGDQLLPGITPTPALQGHHGTEAPDWRFRSFPKFLAALQALRRLQPARCFPGHGEPFGDVGAVIDANLSQAEQRLERALGTLKLRGPLTLYALAHELYPRAVRRRFWQIAATVQGLLDVLEARGLVFEDGGRWCVGQAAARPAS
ncbi:MAG: putative metallo-hydrolase YqjP [Tepidiforma sp.]|nr:MAG: putative metallo-hydrolase YqjP [Tepidiforma sp.]